MAVKCDVCGKMTNTYRIIYSGDAVCVGTCIHAFHLESYLLRLEDRRLRDEPQNKRAYQQAREMSAWLSVYKYGNKDASRRAAAVINAWAH